MSDKRKLSVYLHTHWDREWYWSFAAYRTQLLEVVQLIVSLLEEGKLDNFLLDGQTCLLDDVSELRPDLSGRIAKLVRAGKLAIGPWYVLADQMLVGGESLIRNLAMGLKASRALGGASMVGYCPDTFGHSADLPRILRGFGIDNAVVWRGVPQLASSPFFKWRSADGSEVLANLLARGYYQTAFNENVDADKLASFLLSFLGLEVKPAYICQKAEPGLNYHAGLKGALLPVGGDHLAPAVDFKEQLQAARKLIKTKVTEPLASIEKDTFVSPAHIEVRSCNLQAYLSEARENLEKELEPLELLAGELRENASARAHEYAYMLAGVLSTRLYLKRENRLAERLLVKILEPLRAACSLFGVHEYPFAQMDELWRLLLKNHPHDSICGCSVDEVHREMLSRFQSLQSAAGILLRQSHEALGRRLCAKNLRLGLGLIDLLEPQSEVLPPVLLFNGSGSTLAAPVPVKLTIPLDSEGPSPALPANLQVIRRAPLREAFLPLSGVPDFKDLELIEGYLPSPAVPPLGFAVTGAGVGIERPAVEIVQGKSNAFDGYVLSNEFFKVSLNNNGDLIVKTQGALSEGEKGRTYKLGHHLVDLADGGDTYNFDPLAGDEPLYARLKAVRPGLKGPLVGSLRLEYEISLPASITERKKIRRPGEDLQAPAVIDFRRSSKIIKHKIETEITLKQGLPLVLFATSFNNQAADHRLEVVFTTGNKLCETYSENHHSLIQRPLAPGSKLYKRLDRLDMSAIGSEAPLDRFPCQRFFVADQQLFFNTGLPEYGAGGSKVSITLLRAVSYLSRARLRTRGGGAGPNLATPQANCLGPVQVNYGWAPALPGEADWRSHAYELADCYESPLMVMPLAASQNLQTSMQSPVLAVESQSVRIMAFYSDGPGSYCLRLLNVEGREITTSLVLHDSLLTALNSGVLWKLTVEELDGRPLVSLFDNEHVAPRRFGLRLKPYQLITVKMSFAT